MVPGETSVHRDPRERDIMTPETRSKTKKPREKRLRLWEPLHLFKIIYLAQLILKSFFLRRGNFRNLIDKVGHLKILIKIVLPLCSGNL